MKFLSSKTKSRSSLLIIFSLLTGCNSPVASPGSKAKLEIPDNTHSNVIKVLDRVQCHETYTGCSQASINEIWDVCIQNGFITTGPPGNVKSSRDLKELVSETKHISNTRPKFIEKTDANGVVTSVPDGVEEYSSSYQAQGYCLGSEYII